MEWSEQHDLALCQEVLVMDPFQFPYRGKERGDVWNQIATNLNASDHPKFKVNKRSVRDRLTLLQAKYKAKIRLEERASGIDCEQTDSDIALEEIINKENDATVARGAAEKKKGEKAAAEEQRQKAVKRLGETIKRRNGEGTDGDEQTKPKKTKRSSSDAVQFLREESERENELRKEEMELRRNELNAKEDLMKAFMQQQQHQTQIMLALLAQRKEEKKN